MKEWVKHVVDCGLAFGISFLSTTLASGHITFTTIGINLITGFLVALVKFRDYWQTQLTKNRKTPTIFF